MPYKCPIKRAAYNKQFNLNNKAKYQEMNKTPKGKKSRTISMWRFIGVKDEDLGAVYDYYLLETHCMICNKEYKSSRDRHLDHDHETGEIRYICCKNCNRWTIG